MSGFARSSAHIRSICARRVRRLRPPRPRDRRPGRLERASTSKPRLRSECPTASPCGSRMPSFGRTSTRGLHRTDLGTRDVVVERDLGQTLERLDVARSRPGDDVVGKLRVRELPCSSRSRSHQSRTNCLSNDGCGPPGWYAVRGPEARRVGRQRLVRRGRPSRRGATPSSNFVSARMIPRASACAAPNR